jgi:hypothetical protein
MGTEGLRFGTAMGFAGCGRGQAAGRRSQSFGPPCAFDGFSRTRCSASKHIERRTPARSPNPEVGFAQRNVPGL